MEWWEWIVIALPLVALFMIIWTLNRYEPNHSTRHLAIFLTCVVILGLYILVGMVMVVRKMVVDGGIFP